MYGSNLPVSDWLRLTLLILCAAGLALTTLIEGVSGKPLPHDVVHLSQSPRITAEVIGAVDHPGSHSLPIGSTVGALLTQAHPERFADLTRLDLTAIARQGEHIDLPCTPWITITLEGAVADPGSVTIEEGTTLGDVLSRLSLRDDATTRTLRKRTLLFDGDRVVVPARKRKTLKKRNVTPTRACG